MHRINAFRGWKEQFRKNEGGVDQLAEGYKTFGFQRHESEQKWTFTEWLPEARSVFLIGDFNNWETRKICPTGEFGRWSIDLPDKRDGLRIQSDHGSVDRVPAWTKLACKDLIGVFNGIMWEPPPSERYVMRHARPPRPANLKIYEAHLGIAGTEERIHTLFGRTYEAKEEGKGYQVTSFFAPSSRFGTPDELKELVDTAHAYGLTVLMDLVHSHCSSNQSSTWWKETWKFDDFDGLSWHVLNYAREPEAWWSQGQAGVAGLFCCTMLCYSGLTERCVLKLQDQWHASLFDYGKYEEYGFDGFRFGGVTSMLQLDRRSNGTVDGMAWSGEYNERDEDLSSNAMSLASPLPKAMIRRSEGNLGVVIERGLALHKMIRSKPRGRCPALGIRRLGLVCMGLGGEARGHFLDQAFDEAMLALENRFKFMASPRYFCSRKDDSDKVVVFEHGDCLFVFNFHPKRSYTEYRVGHSWNENMRVVLDSDEPCFGGQDRLASAHETSFPPLDGWDSRYHSAEMFLPSRTVQVLVRESLLEGGVTVAWRILQ
ncbi:unnamed protein product [Cladocopium goreaui]|uniref:1,4-alpha-glucan branching enzyme n=1 Tax=Cladocopium goreaui TaxID=2562237 RepID=A0A9P1C1B8_9DINO|nr:unnamed protein product [Cladocopium goreaui]